MGSENQRPYVARKKINKSQPSAETINPARISTNLIVYRYYREPSQIQHAPRFPGHRRQQYCTPCEKSLTARRRMYFRWRLLIALTAGAEIYRPICLR
jgi:hypothetical protein